MLVMLDVGCFCELLSSRLIGTAKFVNAYTFMCGFDHCSSRSAFSLTIPSGRGEIGLLQKVSMRVVHWNWHKRELPSRVVLPCL